MEFCGSSLGWNCVLCTSKIEWFLILMRIRFLSGVSVLTTDKSTSQVPTSSHDFHSRRQCRLQRSSSRIERLLAMRGPSILYLMISYVVVTHNACMQENIRNIMDHNPFKLWEWCMFGMKNRLPWPFAPWPPAATAGRVIAIHSSNCFKIPFKWYGGFHAWGYP